MGQGALGAREEVTQLAMKLNAPVAKALLGKAVKIANDSGNEATAKLLRRVVDVEDAEKGTVRLKQAVAREDSMALETRSTKTARIIKSSETP